MNFAQNLFAGALLFFIVVTLVLIPALLPVAVVIWVLVLRGRAKARAAEDRRLGRRMRR